MEKLAILGGKSILPSSLEKYISINQEEIDAVTKVMKSGCLSGFLGSWEDGFLGGPEVQKFESLWSNFFNVRFY